MRGNSFFVCSTDLTNATPASINGKPAISFYTAMIGTVQRFAGAETSSLFAEPVMPEGYSSNSAAVSWYSSRDGNATAFASLDEVAKKPAFDRLKQLFMNLEPLLRDPAFGPALSSWLNITSPKDILLIGGEPVLINWGFLPVGVPGSQQTRDTHFQQTTGLFTQSISTPAIEAYMQGTAIGLAASQVSGQRRITGEGGSSMGKEQAAGVAGPAGRPWLPPLIANLVALAVLLVLTIPGVLRYPSFPDRSEAGRLEEERLRASNDNLDKELQALQTKLAALTCRAPDAPPALLDEKSDDNAIDGKQR